MGNISFSLLLPLASAHPTPIVISGQAGPGEGAALPRRKSVWRHRYRILTKQRKSRCFPRYLRSFIGILENSLGLALSALHWPPWP